MHDCRFQGVLCALFVFPLLGTATVRAERKSYDGYQTVRVDVRTPQEWATLQTLTEDIWRPDGLSTDAVWGNEVGPGSFDVLIDPAHAAALAASGLSYEVLIANLGPVVAAQYAESEAPPALRGGSFNYTTYHDLATINSHVAWWAATYPNLAQAVSIGTSLEGRPMNAIRITGPGDASQRPGFFFHGGQHAREWVNVPVPMYAAEWLLTNYGVDPLATRLVDEIEWFILPVMNPDGYSYTWTNERFWRKNRRPNSDGTFGVDLNRNWGFNWGGLGASTQPNDETFRGTSGFSEPETQAARDFILAHTNIAAYIDYHSYSQLAMWPYGYTDVPCADDGQFEFLMDRMVDLMQDVHQVRYVDGAIYSTIYPASGSSVDWAYGANLPGRKILAVTFELRDKGQNGFTLPENQILPTCEENLPAILEMAKWISEPLRVDLVGDPVLYAPPGDTFRVTVRVTEHLGAFTQQQVSLFHRVGPGAFTETEMTANGDGTYSAVIPPVACPGVVGYYVTAWSDDGRAVNLPLEGAAGPSSYRAGRQVYFLDDMEVDRGWQAGVSGDNAVRGLWERSDPIGNGAQPSDDHTPASGTRCFNTDGRTNGTDISVSDVDNGKTTLLSPVLDVHGGDPAISFWYWYSNDQGAAPNADVMPVQVSNNNGSSWTTVMQISTNAQRWQHVEFRLADFVAPTAQVRLRVVAQDLATGSVVEAAVDDLIVEDRACPAIDGDVSGDDHVTSADLSVFSGCMNGPLGEEVTGQCGLFNFDLDTDIDIQDWVALQRRMVP